MARLINHMWWESKATCGGNQGSENAFRFRQTDFGTQEVSPQQTVMPFD